MTRSLETRSLMPRSLSRRQALALLGASAALAPGAAAAAPKSRLIDPTWRRHGAADDIDHSAWSELLARRLSRGPDGVARFDYAAAAREDRAAIDAYLALLEAARPTTQTALAAYAYWLNLYNAATIKVVLEEYPVRSIKEVRGGLFNTGPWTDEIVAVEGAALSLDDIEHGVLRPVFRDPRIHYGVNCASIGCPDLLRQAFTAARLEADLEAAARAYVNHPRGARVENGRLTVSSIYIWFQEDFGGDDAGVIAHLKRYAEPSLRAALEGVTRISDDAYDWDLNDAT